MYHLKLGEKGGKYIFRIYRLFFMDDASEPNLSLGGSSFQPFTIAIPDKRFEHIRRFAMQNGLDGIMTGNVLNLSTTEIISGGKERSISIIQRWYHRLPNL